MRGKRGSFRACLPFLRMCAARRGRGRGSDLGKRREGGARRATDAKEDFQVCVGGLCHGGGGGRGQAEAERIVPSHYMQYERKASGKTASDTSLSFAKGTDLTASPKRPPGHFQKYKSVAEMTPGVLQSTLVDSHASARPDLEFSIINEKSRSRVPTSKGGAKGGREKTQPLESSSNPEDLIDMLDSQALLVMYASLKLDALGPVSQQSARFMKQYKHFGAALDLTWHELPLKGIHMGENKSQVLDDLQGGLAGAQQVLSRAVEEHTAENVQVLSCAKELEEASLKVDAELPRAFVHVLDLSADVSKEASLHFQKVCKDALGLEATKQLYFG